MPENQQQEIAARYVAHIEKKLNAIDLAEVEAALSDVPNLQSAIHTSLAGVTAKVGGVFQLASYLETKAQLMGVMIGLPTQTSDIVPRTIDGNTPSPIAFGKNIEGKMGEADSSWSEIIDEDDRTDISPMDYEALCSIKTMGKIMPGLFGMFHTGIKIPTPEGFAHIKPKNKRALDTKELPSFEDADVNPSTPGENQHIVTVPSRVLSERIPLTFGYGYTACSEEEGLMISEPNPENPLISHNLDTLSSKQVTLLLEKNTNEPVADPAKFKPTPEEVAYWQKVMPLPQKVADECTAHPELAKELIAQFMRENFLYVCNDSLGKFISENADDLPLIMDELRVGHCDLLSWAEAAYLRGLGIPAVVASGLVTNKDGTSFMKDYGHSRVAVVDEKDGKLSFQDPSRSCYLGTGFHGKELQPAVVEKLNTAYQKCTDEKEKRMILRQFLRNNPRLKSKDNTDDTSRLSGWITSAEISAEEFARASMPPRLVDEHRIRDRVVITGDRITAAEAGKLLKEYIGAFELDLNYAPIKDEYTRRNIQNLLDFSARHRLSMPTSEMSDDYLLRGQELPYFLDRFLYAGRFEIMIPGFSDQFKNKKTISEITGDVVRRPQLMATLAMRTLHMHNPGLSHDFEFSYESIQRLKSINPQNFDKESKAGLDLGTASDYTADPSAAKILAECCIFLSLAVEAFRNPALLEQLQRKIGVERRYFEELADVIQPIKTSKTRRTSNNPHAALDKNIAPDNLVDVEAYYKKYFLPNAEAVMTRKNLKKLVAIADRSKKRTMRTPRPEGWQLVEYNPDAHDARLIDSTTSARAGKPMAKVPELMRGESEPFHVYLDLTHEGNAAAWIYSTIEVVVDELKKIAGHDREIFITTSNATGYVKIKPGRNCNPRAISRLLGGAIEGSVRNNAIKDNFDYLEKKTDDLGITSDGAVPSNLIYLSDSEGKVGAVQFQLGKKINLVARTFDEAGVKAYCRIRNEWVASVP